MLRSALTLLSLVATLLAGTLVTRADAAEIDLGQECPDLRADEVFRKEPAYGPSGEVIARFVDFMEFRRSAALAIGVGAYDKLTRLEAPAVDADRVKARWAGRSFPGTARSQAALAHEPLLPAPDARLGLAAPAHDRRNVPSKVE